MDETEEDSFTNEIGNEGTLDSEVVCSDLLGG